jgi:hypothetical protein
MKRLLAAGLCLLAFASPAAAQTAEEAVGYVFLGLADGGKIVRGKTTMDWKELGASPAIFEGAGNTNGHAYTIRFTVSATAPCDYEITLEGPKDMVPGEKRLFAKVALDKVSGVTVSPDGFKIAVAGDGFCETGRTNPDCNAIEDPDLFASVDADRHNAALQFIKSAVCTAKP